MSAKKSRFDGLDVAAMTSHVKRTMLGFKLANVYDGNALGVSGTGSSGGGGSGDGAKGVYMFKLADPSGGPSSLSSAVVTVAVDGNNNNIAPPPPQDAAGTSPPGDDGSGGAASTSDQKRAMLLIESGVRFHPTTHYSQSTGGSSSTPSPFSLKLRKHLRNLRLENVTQLGNLDRVVDFRFGSGSYAHHLILELYAQGNLILCDGEYRILALLRTHEYEVSTSKKDDDGYDEEKKDVIMGENGKEEVKVRVGNIYPVTFATTLTAEGISNPSSTDESSVSAAKCGILAMDASDAFNWARAELSKVQMMSLAANNEMKPLNTDGKCGTKGKTLTGKKAKKKAIEDSLVLKALLLKPNSGVYHYGPSLIEHCIWTAGIDPLVRLSIDNIQYTLPEAQWDDLITALREEGSRVIGNLISGEGGSGYILYKSKATNDIAKNNDDDRKKTEFRLPPSVTTQNPHSDKTLLEFQPHILHQHQDQQYLKYATFSIATDEFFSHLSSQRVTARAEAAEAAARDRLVKIEADQRRRVEELVKEQERLKDSAQLVERHAEDIDRALGVINSALSSGMDWVALEQLVSVEQANENPIALMIQKLLLDRDQVILALPDIDNWDDYGQDGLPPIRNVTISIKESAHCNARIMFAAYRASKEKEEKTIDASTTALKAAEEKARLQLAEAQKKKERVQVLPVRKSYWFEKFAWFITSDNYLVVAGKDAQQNEQLVKRYLRPGDAYLHAEVHGAATCILRAKRRRRKDGKTQVIPLSDQALREAGSFTICRSSAWKSKMVTSAYWVESHQVSKTAPTGEYLSVGAFMIRGRKNFLPASTLEMGLGVLFRLGDEASIARHANERRDFLLLEQEQMYAHQENGMVEECVAASEAATVKSSIEDHVSTDEHVSSVEHVEITMEKDFDDEGNMDFTEKQLAEVSSLKDDKTEYPEPAISKVSSPDFEENHAKNINPQSTKKGVTELSRGKRSKEKRAKKKYCEQDEIDRELVMMALHGGESSKTDKKGRGGRKIVSESVTQLKAAEQTVALLVRDPKTVADILDEDVRQTISACITVKDSNGVEEVRWNKFDADVLEQLSEMDTRTEQLAAATRLLDLSTATRVDNFSASLAGIIRTIKKHGVQDTISAAAQQGDGKQRKSKAEKQAEREAWQEVLAEDGIIDFDVENMDSAVDDTAELGRLTGKPTAQDNILYALPVCAPYSVLSQYTYRVKLTPGSVKRGKACKQAVEVFLETKKKQVVDEGAKRDQALIKLVNENEWVQAMVGDVRITSAGASKATTKQKVKGK